MADIVIRGMEMPENCDKCIYSGWSNFYQIYVCNVVRKGNPLLFNGKQVKSTAIKRSGRAENCPLIALPEGHGRLVDADALGEKLKQHAEYHLDDSQSGVFIAAGIKQCCDILNGRETPTIVPAEKKGVE